MLYQINANTAIGGFSIEIFQQCSLTSNFIKEVSNYIQTVLQVFAMTLFAGKADAHEMKKIKIDDLKMKHWLMAKLW